MYMKMAGISRGTYSLVWCRLPLVQHVAYHSEEVVSLPFSGLIIIDGSNGVDVVVISSTFLPRPRELAPTSAQPSRVFPVGSRASTILVDQMDAIDELFLIVLDLSRTHPIP
jgi:hypothetical protein